MSVQLPKHILEKLQVAVDQTNRMLLKAESARLSANYGAGSERHVSQSHGRRIKNAHQRLAYLIARFPATYGACYKALEELTYSHLNFESILDLGAGPGTATLSAIQLFPEIEKMVLLDQDAEFKAFAEQIFPNRDLKYHIMDLRQTAIDLPTSDLVISSYCLNELDMDKALQLVQQGWNVAGKALVLVEPGTPACYEKLMALRKNLIEWGAHLFAPCPHMDVCPLTASNWCHFSVKLQRSELHRYVKDASLPYENEKFSYLIFTKEPIKSVDNRIITRPLKRGGHVTFDLCSQNGVKRLTLSKKDKAIYQESLKLEWGEAFDNKSQ